MLLIAITRFRARELRSQINLFSVDKELKCLNYSVFVSIYIRVKYMDTTENLIYYNLFQNDLDLRVPDPKLITGSSVSI